MPRSPDGIVLNHGYQTVAPLKHCSDDLPTLSLNHGYQTVAPLKLVRRRDRADRVRSLNHGYQTVAPLKLDHVASHAVLNHGYQTVAPLKLIGGLERFACWSP